MELDVRERLATLGILPNEGNFVTLRILRDLKRSLSFTEEEFKALELKQHDTEQGATLTWNQEADTPKDIHIGEKAVDIIKGALKELDSKGKLTETHFGIYEKFMNPDKE